MKRTLQFFALVAVALGVAAALYEISFGLSVPGLAFAVAYTFIGAGVSVLFLAAARIIELLERLQARQ